MAKTVTAGVEVKLKDSYSQGIYKAAAASDTFARQTTDALKKVDSVFSGTAAKLGALGVGLSLGAAAKGMIDLDHRMTRIGLSANASAGQVAKLKQTIYNAALAAKLDVTPITDAVAQVMEKVGDLDFTTENILNIAKAIQATGESGESLGNTFSALANLKFSAADSLDFFDRAAAISDKGAFGLGEFARHAETITASYASVGTSVDDMANAMKALQIIYKGIGSGDESVTAMNMMLTELRTKQDELSKKGIRVKVPGTDNLRDLNDIMEDVVKVIEREGSSDDFYDIFGARSMRVVAAYKQFGKDMRAEFDRMGDASGSLQRRVDAMGGTFKSNLQAVQTAFNRFADANMGTILKPVTGFLNSMAEDPKRFDATFRAITRGLIAISAIKIGTGVMSFIESLRAVQRGSPLIPQSGSGTGAAPMPVYVTNWEGVSAFPPAGGGRGIPVPGPGTLLDQYGNPIAPATPGSPADSPAPAPKRRWTFRKPNMKGAGKAGLAAALITAVMAVPDMAGELIGISKNDELTGKEKSEARGGAIGEAVGAVGGAALGTMIGAAIGSVLPGPGTVLGAIVGGFIGQYGGVAGRWIGSHIGAAAAEGEDGSRPANDPATTEAWMAASRRDGSFKMPVLTAPPQLSRTGTELPPPKVELDGRAMMDISVTVDDDRTHASVSLERNTLPIQVNTGPAREVRGGMV